MGLLNRYDSKMHGNYWNAIFKYGFLVGLGLVLVVLFRHWLSMPLSQPVTYAENIALLVFMFIVVFLYRKSLQEKKITFKEAYIVGFGVGIVSSIMYGMFLYVFSLYIDTEFQQRCFEIQREIKSNAHLNDEQISAMSSSSAIAFSGILLSSIMSILWAMIVGILLRNEQAPLKIKK